MFLLGEMHADIKIIKEQAIRTNGRVSALEVWVNSAKGKLAVISAVIGFGVAAGWDFIKSKLL